MPRKRAHNRVPRRAFTGIGGRGEPTDTSNKNKRKTPKNPPSPSKEDRITSGLLDKVREQEGKSREDR